MNIDDGYRRLHERASREPPELALVLGSGLGELVRRVQAVEDVSYGDISSLSTPTVSGHQGRVVLGSWIGRRIVVFSGRVHFYEGEPWEKVLQPIHIARKLGAQTLILTNAAGGIRDDLEPGHLLALSGHLDCTGPRFWLADGPARLNPFDPILLRCLQDAASRVGFSLPAGVYAQVTGPCYETPAEIRALRWLGADAVGMSTAREALRGRELGMNCLALSCITNRAAGLGSQPIQHGDVLAVTAQATRKMADLLEEFLQDETRFTV